MFTMAFGGNIINVWVLHIINFMRGSYYVFKHIK